MDEGASPKRLATLAAVAVAAILVVSALAVAIYLMQRDSDDSEPVGILRIGTLEAVDSLNPFQGQSLASNIVYGLLYDCLQGVGDDMDSERNLAISWVIDADYEPYGSAWQFNLTENARWHDGEPFDAHDVEFTLNCHAKNFTEIWSHRPYAYFMNYAEVVDNYTVRVHFCDRSTGEPMPVAFADSLLIPIMPKHLLENESASYISFSWHGIFEGHNPPIVGTGPFMVTEDVYDEFLEGDRLTLVRNPHYHRAADRGEEISYEKIFISFFDDVTALEIALEIGYVDVASFPPSGFATLNRKVEDGAVQNVHLYSGPTCAQRQTHLAFSMQTDIWGNPPNPSICDPTIRQAISMATNKSIVIDEYYVGFADEGSTVIPPLNGEWHCDIAEPLEFNPATAAELLEEHGYRYTTESPDVRVATSACLSVANGWVEENASLSYDMVLMMPKLDGILLKDVVESWVSEWSDIGITVNLTTFSETAIPITPPPRDLTVNFIDMSHPDPNHLLYALSSCAVNGWNLCGYSNATYDQHYIDSVQQLNVEQRRESVKECQRTHYLDVGTIVLAYPHQMYAWRTDTFTGWGDWSEHPGRSVDACWGGNQLYFDLEAILSTKHSESPSVVGALTTAGIVATSVTCMQFARGAKSALTSIQP